jgi:sulfite reductase beta subunit-like hemoprotein
MKSKTLSFFHVYHRLNRIDDGHSRALKKRVNTLGLHWLSRDVQEKLGKRLQKQGHRESLKKFRKQTPFSRDNKK